MKIRNLKFQLFNHNIIKISEEKEQAIRMNAEKIK